MADRLDALMGILQHMILNKGGERDAAISRFTHLLKQEGRSIGDLKLILNGSSGEDSLYSDLKTALVQAQRENIFLRRHVSKSDLTKALQAKEIEYHWPEVIDLLEQRTPDRVRSYVVLLHELLDEPYGLSLSVVRMWEEGTATVPQYVLEFVKGLPSAVKSKSTTIKPSKKKKTNDVPRSPIVDDGPDDEDGDDFVWSPAIYQRMIELAKSGLSDSAIAKDLGMKGKGKRSEGRVTGKLNNVAPNEELLESPVSVKRQGPMDCLELWKIGISLYRGGSWIKQLDKRFEHSTRPKRWRWLSADQVLSPEHIDWLRREYEAKISPPKDGSHVSTVYRAVLEAGPDGIDGAQLKNILPSTIDTSRYNEAATAGLIYAPTRVGRANLWVATIFKEINP